MDTLIDKLNKLLTNTLEYKEALQKLSESVSDTTTSDKLKELADVKKKESETLMQLISEAGGRVESSDRMTDQQSVSWMTHPLPDAKDMSAVLNCLVKAEQKAKKDYSAVLENEEEEEELNDKTKEIIEMHRKEASSNLEYFESAQASQKK